MNIKKLIVEKFIEIGNKEGFDNITINKIVKVCGISRTSFYYHFKDIPDVIDYYLYEKMSAVSNVCAELKNMKKGVTYCAKTLIYDFPECRKLLESKWRNQTEMYLHKHWRDYAEKMISSNRRGVPIKEEERLFLVQFISGAICDWMIHGDHQKVDVQTYAEQFCLLLNARHAMMEKEK